MSQSERELPIPEGVDVNGAQNTELVRIWWQEGSGRTGPRMIIRPALREPELVGAMLAELAYHFAVAFGERTDRNQDDALAEIKQAWTAAHARAESKGETQ